MVTLNNVPSSGKFNAITSVINDNFSLVQQAVQQVGLAHSKGMFATLAELQTAVPQPEDGDWGIVGASADIYTYTTAGGWQQNGTYSGTIDLNGYATKTSVDTLTARVGVIETDYPATEETNREEGWWKLAEVCTERSFNTSASRMVMYHEKTFVNGQTYRFFIRNGTDRTLTLVIRNARNLNTDSIIATIANVTADKTTVKEWTCDSDEALWLIAQISNTTADADFTVAVYGDVLDKMQDTIDTAASDISNVTGVVTGLAATVSDNYTGLNGRLSPVEERLEIIHDIVNMKAELVTGGWTFEPEVWTVNDTPATGWLLKHESNASRGGIRIQWNGTDTLKYLTDVSLGDYRYEYHDIGFGVFIPENHMLAFDRATKTLVIQPCLNSNTFYTYVPLLGCRYNGVIFGLLADSINALRAGNLMMGGKQVLTTAVNRLTIPDGETKPRLYTYVPYLFKAGQTYRIFCDNTSDKKMVVRFTRRMTWNSGTYPDGSADAVPFTLVGSTSTARTQLDDSCPAGKVSVFSVTMGEYDAYFLQGNTSSPVTSGDITLGVIGALADRMMTATEKEEEIRQDESGVPMYWIGHLDGKAALQRAIDGNMGETGHSFIFFTDIHSWSNRMKSPALISSLLRRTGVRDVVFGGDIPHNNAKASSGGTMNSLRTEMQRFEQWRKRIKESGGRLYPCHGNHDLLQRDGDGNNLQVLSRSQVTRPFMFGELPEGCVPQSADSSDGGMYYYKDIPEGKTRMIVVDVFNSKGDAEDQSAPSDTERQWLHPVLQGVPSGWAITVITHGGMIPFTRGGSATTSGDYDGNDILYSEIKEYIARGFGDKALIVCGHHHSDAVMYHAGCWHVATLADACFADAKRSPMHYAGGSGEFVHYSGETSARHGTTGEQQFDIITTDWTRGVIRCLRIGTGEGGNRFIHTAPVTLSVGGTFNVLGSTAYIGEVLNITCYDNTGYTENDGAGGWTLPSLFATIVGGTNVQAQRHGVPDDDNPYKASIVCAVDADGNQEYWCIIVNG